MNRFFRYIQFGDEGETLNHGSIRTLLVKILYPYFDRMANLLNHIDEEWKKTIVLAQRKQENLQIELQSLNNRLGDVQNLKREFVSHQNQLLELSNEFQALEKVRTELALQEMQLRELSNQFRIIEFKLDTQVETASLEIKPFDFEGVMILGKYGIFLSKKNDLISETLRESGVWDQHIIQALDDFTLDRNGIAIDVGSHIGSLSIPLSKHFDQVHAFEANDDIFAILKINKLINDADNLIIHNRPLFSTETQISLSKPEEQDISLKFLPSEGYLPMASFSAASYSFNINGTGKYSKMARTLDSYDFRDVSFIKIDAQGSDLEILEGSRATIAKYKPMIIFEYEQKLSNFFNCKLSETLLWLNGMGYQIKILHQHNEKQQDYICYLPGKHEQ
jgi:FkbM family methyltransferase